MQEHGVPIDRVINGGGIPQKNEVLNRVYANVLNKPVLVPETEVTSLGAAIFALLAAGEFASIAFAIWDGKKTDSGQPKEKGSEKAISSWWYFRADAPPDYSPYMYALLAVALALGFEMVLVRRLKKGS